MVKCNCPLIPISNNRKATQILTSCVSSSMFLSDLMGSYKLDYGNADKEQIAPAVGKQLLRPLNTLEGAQQDLGHPPVLRTSCSCSDSMVPVGSILLSCKAAAPGTRWLLASTGAAVAVSHRSTVKRHPSGGKLLLIRCCWELLALLGAISLSLPLHCVLLTEVSLLMQAKWLHQDKAVLNLHSPRTRKENQSCVTKVCYSSPSLLPQAGFVEKGIG